MYKQIGYLWESLNLEQIIMEVVGWKEEKLIQIECRCCHIGGWNWNEHMLQNPMDGNRCGSRDMNINQGGETVKGGLDLRKMIMFATYCITCALYLYIYS